MSKLAPVFSSATALAAFTTALLSVPAQAQVTPCTTVADCQTGQLCDTTTSTCYFTACTDENVDVRSRHADVWPFGNGCQLSWDADLNLTFGTEPNLMTFEGTASFSDPDTGELLIYTNGITVWNGSGTVVGNNLGGHDSAMHSGVIVPAPTQPGQVYVIGHSFTLSTKITYQKFDLDNGASPVGAPVDVTVGAAGNEAAEGMVYVPHANGIDGWLLVSGVTNIWVLPVTAAGIGAPVAHAHGLTLWVPGWSLFAASHQNDRLVMSSNDGGEIAAFDFDAATGAISNRVSLAATFSTNYYGGVFSPNGSKFYFAAITEAAGGTVSSFYQYNFDDQQFTQLSTDPIRYQYGDARLGPDGKIYVAGNTTNSVHVISDPDLAGAACNFGFQELTQPAGCTTRLGMTQVPSVTSSLSINPEVSVTSPPSVVYIGSGVTTSTVSGNADAPDGATVFVTVTGPNGYSATCSATVAGLAWSCPVDGLTGLIVGDYNAIATVTYQTRSACSGHKFRVDNCADTGTHEVVDAGCAEPTSECAVGGAETSCVVCEDDSEPGAIDGGCDDATPTCDTSVAGGDCVGCTEDADCPGTMACSPNNECYFVDCDDGTINEERSRHADVWPFGGLCRLSWDSDLNLSFTTDPSIDTGEGSTAFSDPETGELLIYSDGNTVWDGAGDQISTGLGGHPSSLHSGVIAPVPGRPGHVFVFGHSHQTTLKLTYQEFNLDNGAVPAGMPIDVPIGTTARPGTEGMLFIPHLNGVDGWLLVSGRFDIYVLPITTTGLGAPTVIDSQLSVWTNGWHLFTATHAGDKLVMSGNNGGAIASWDFDRGTGALTNRTELVATYTTEYYGGVFSPDDSKLYFSSLTKNGNTGSFHQYNFDNGVFTELSSVTPRYTHGDGRLGPDGKIYVNGRNSGGVHVVTDPNAAGAACGFMYNGLTPPAGCTSKLGLPQIPSPTAQIALTVSVSIGTPGATLVGSSTTLSGSANAPDGALVFVTVTSASGYTGTCTGVVSGTQWSCPADSVSGLTTGTYTAIATITSGLRKACTSHTFEVVTCEDTAPGADIDSGCTTDEPVCNTAEAPVECVECVIDDHCSAGSVCSDNVCVDCRDDAVGEPADSGCAEPESECKEGAGGSECVICEDDAAPGAVDGGCTSVTPACDTSNAVGTGGFVACVECLDDADCGAGTVCNTTSKTCESCTDDMAGEPADSGCAEPTSECAVATDGSGTCVVCEPDGGDGAVDGGCTAALPACIQDMTGAGTCVECTSDLDCGVDGLCDQASNTCVACLDTGSGAATDAGCFAGAKECGVDASGDAVCVVCEDDAGAGEIDGGCSATDPVCVTDDGGAPICVQCGSDDDCAGGVCSDGSCIGCSDDMTGEAADSGCAEPASECDADASGGPTCVACENDAAAGAIDGGCDATLPACDAATGAAGECVECTEDADCADGTCDLTSNTCELCADSGVGESVDLGCAEPSSECDESGASHVCVVCEDDAPAGSIDGGCDALTPACATGDGTVASVCVECQVDEDCAGGAVCDDATNTCQACLDTASGAATDTGCAVGAKECATDDAGTNACVLCQDDAVPSAIDGGCSASSPHCVGDAGDGAGGSACVVCIAETDCAEGSICDVASGQCTGCTDDGTGDAVDSGCEAPNGECAEDDQTGTSSCVPCEDDSDGTDSGCDEAAPNCVDDGTGAVSCVACSDDDDCAEGLVCAPDGACVPCIDDAPDGAVDQGCTEAAPVCVTGQTAADNACVVCTSDSGCDDGGWCLDGVCIEADVDSDSDGLTDDEEEALGTDPSDADTDNDGIDDGDEVGGGDPSTYEPGTDTNPLDADTDDDGLSDGEEMATGTDPLDGDSDGDGLGDGLESGVTDPVGGGTSDGGIDFEGTGPGFVPDGDPTTMTDPNDDDSDDDGITDGNEDANGDGAVDNTLGDSMSEGAGETDPNNADTDGDGIQDGTESGVTLPQGDDTDLGVFQPDLDPASTSDPLDLDTDDGGVDDGVEDPNFNGQVDEGETAPELNTDDAQVVDAGVLAKGGACAGGGLDLGLLVVLMSLLTAGVAAQRRRRRLR